MESLKPGSLPPRETPEPEFEPPPPDILKMPSRALEPGASVSAVVRPADGDLGPAGFPRLISWESIDQLRKTGYMPRVLHGHSERDDKGREIHAYSLILLTRP